MNWNAPTVNIRARAGKRSDGVVRSAIKVIDSIISVVSQSPNCPLLGKRPLQPVRLSVPMAMRRMSLPYPSNYAERQLVLSAQNLKLALGKIQLLLYKQR